MTTGYIVGSVLAVAVATLGRTAGFDRDRAFYSTILIVVGSYYVLFAVMGGSMHALAVELIGFSVFVACAVAGFRKSVWLLVGGLAGHGVFDYFHGHLVSNPGVPEWWPAFCLAYDVGAAACLAWIQVRLVGGVRQASGGPGNPWGRHVPL
jgi:hypothetical protein